jgi:hypothetical protein
LLDGAEAGVSSGPEHTWGFCVDPHTPRRPRQARKDPGRSPPPPPLAKLAIYPYHIIAMDRVLEFAIELALESGRIQKRHSIFHKGRRGLVNEHEKRV